MQKRASSPTIFVCVHVLCTARRNPRKLSTAHLFTTAELDSLILTVCYSAPIGLAGGALGSDPERSSGRFPRNVGPREQCQGAGTQAWESSAAAASSFGSPQFSEKTRHSRPPGFPFSLLELIKSQPCPRKQSVRFPAGGLGSPREEFSRTTETNATPSTTNTASLSPLA